VAQKPKRLAQCVTGAGVIQLGPEQRYEPITAVQTQWACRREVDEQRDTLWLGQHAVQHPIVGRTEIDGTERT
jgi:hypothetical protein